MRSIDRHLVSVTAPASMEAEQYQTLRLRIERLRRTRDLKVIAITSPGARDGKTVTAINLAATLARSARVLLIEADIRRPAIARYVGLDRSAANNTSLVELVNAKAGALQDSVQRLDPLRFDVLLAGAATTPAHEMFRSPRLEMVIKEAREQYDYVLLDTPPIGLVSDCGLLAPLADGLLLVVAAHKTPRKMLESSLNQLDGSTVLGIVYNGDDRPIFGYRNSYYQGYFPRTEKGSSTAIISGQ